MKILIACEFSGTVRDAFIAKGHDAISCDLLPTESPGPHYQGDVNDIINDGWDMMIAFPPCTHLALSGARWFKEKIADGRQQEGIDFFMSMVNAPIDKICIENPPGVMSTKYRKPDQYVQPYWFGDSFQKKTGLWLKNLSPLIPTKMVDRGEIWVTKDGKKRGGAWTMMLSPSEDRWKIRSKTFQGIANAMADQWG